MKNFKLTRHGYEYTTAESGEMIVVSLDYRKDGPRGRGIYAGIQPETREDGRRSFLLCSGISGFLMRLDRKSDTALAAVAEKLDSAAIEAAKVFEGVHDSGPNAPNPKEAIEILRAALVTGLVVTA